jgi:palmitoyltransferase
VSTIFFLFLSSLFWYHLFLLFFNRSTLEQFRTPIFVNCGAEKKSYHLGKMSNFRQVFGSIPFQWCLPIYSTVGDGLSYPLNSKVSDTVIKECNGAYGFSGANHFQLHPAPPLPPGASVVYSNENTSVRIDTRNNHDQQYNATEIGTQV